MTAKVHYEDFSDAQLLDALKMRDHALAFTEIYDRYWTPLVLHVHRMVREEELAQDIVQELFTGVYQKIDHLEITSSLSSYLYNAARHKVFNAIKRQKIKSNYLQSIADFETDHTCQADGQLRLKQLTALIESEIDKMPPKMREIFNLSRKKHLSHKEIANLLNISEHTVRTQIQRALKMLRSNPEIRVVWLVLFNHFLD